MLSPNGSGVPSRNERLDMYLENMMCDISKEPGLSGFFQHMLHPFAMAFDTDVTDVCLLYGYYVTLVGFKIYQNLSDFSMLIWCDVLAGRLGLTRCRWCRTHLAGLQHKWPSQPRTETGETGETWWRRDEDVHIGVVRSRLPWRRRRRELWCETDSPAFAATLTLPATVLDLKCSYLVLCSSVFCCLSCLSYLVVALLSWFLSYCFARLSLFEIDDDVYCIYRPLDCSLFSCFSLSGNVPEKEVPIGSSVKRTLAGCEVHRQLSKQRIREKRLCQRRTKPKW